jgi:long-chain fatty acid transport protein
MRRLAGAAAVMLWLTPAVAGAQSNDEVFPQFQFNFSTPGARANAMGRAFVGLADDASASITNPAGLVRLTRRQAYFEFKTTDLSVDRLAGTRSLFTLEPTTFGATVGAAAFASVSMPVGDRFAVAFTRHQFLNHQETFNLDPRPIPRTEQAFFGVDGESSFQGASYAGSIAMLVNDRFRVGITLSFDQLSAESVATRFDFDRTDAADQFALAQTNLIVSQTRIDDSATGVGLTAGALFVPNDEWSFGVTFAKGASLSVEETLAINPSDASNAPLQVLDGFPKTVTIHVPNRLGLGASYRPNSRLLVAADMLYVGYSSLTRDFTLIFGEGDLDPDDYEVDNAVEAHLGAEYLLVTGPNLVFVRGGVFTSPDHATRYLGAGSTVSERIEQAKYNQLRRRTDVVGTAGAGVVFGTRFQIDVAVVFGREFVGSAALRF